MSTTEVTGDSNSQVERCKKAQAEAARALQLAHFELELLLSSNPPGFAAQEIQPSLSFLDKKWGQFKQLRTQARQHENATNLLLKSEERLQAVVREQLLWMMLFIDSLSGTYRGRSI
jgi:hypothetical protein